MGAWTEPTTGDESAIARAVRLAQREHTTEDVDWVCSVFLKWVRAEGSAPFERCAHLPTTTAQLRLAMRDRELVKAARQIEASSSWEGSHLLAEELDTYLTRGGWLSWRDSDTLPQGASELRQALHRALRHSEGKPLGAKQLQRLVGHVWSAKCP
jgi:hypothetical protein